MACFPKSLMDVMSYLLFTVAIIGSTQETLLSMGRRPEGINPPRRGELLGSLRGRHIMTKVTTPTTFGLDTAKHVSQVHGTDKVWACGTASEIEPERNGPFLLWEQSPCLVGIEASGSAH